MKEAFVHFCFSFFINKKGGNILLFIMYLYKNNNSIKFNIYTADA